VLRVMPSLPRSALRPLGVLVLIGVLITLTGILGPHELEHLKGAAGKADRCPICAWSHGASTGIAMVVVLACCGLPALGELLPGVLRAPETRCPAPVPSRAPPRPV